MTGQRQREYTEAMNQEDVILNTMLLVALAASVAGVLGMLGVI